MTVFAIENARHAAPARRVGLFARATAAMEAISNALIALQEWQARAGERRRLLGLSDAALKDFGACRSIAEGEGSKPFWQA